MATDLLDLEMPVRDLAFMVAIMQGLALDHLGNRADVTNGRITLPVRQVDLVVFACCQVADMANDLLDKYREVAEAYSNGG